MAPLRFYSHGYTGNKSYENRLDFNYADYDVKDCLTILESFITGLKTYNSIDPFEFTQFVRGRLFILIDSLLTSNFSIKAEHYMCAEKEELLSIVKLCETYIKFYNEWLSLLPRLYQSVISTTSIVSECF